MSGKPGIEYPTAPRPIIKVTKDILARAEQRNSGHCAIADAIKAACPWAIFISVDLQTIRFSDPERGLRYVYLTPRNAQQFIVNYDHGTHTSPFQFKLPRGAQVTKMANKPGTHPKVAKSKIVKYRSGVPSGKHFPTATAQLLNAGDKVPRIVGGREPPSPKYSQRREYGLRGLVR
jgi:hypothetical protein